MDGHPAVVARLLLEQFGDDAPRYAAARLEGSRRHNDMEGCRRWKAVFSAVEELLRDRPPA